ncbi:MAG: hypothetical protein EON98_07130 [Chitinophagaceae bacterium]|nr:MAG: hypothetical protein EON98_07130 [Chitinophagaceae bacterium]
MGREIPFAPVFVKQGSFIPQIQYSEKTKGNTTAFQKGENILTYFPSSELTKFEWYNDDGNSKAALQSGNYTLIRCSGQEKPGKISIVLDASNKRYLKNELVLSVVSLKTQPKMVYVNGKSMNMAEVGPFELSEKEKKNTAHWRNEEKQLQLHIEFGSVKKLNIEIIK